MEFTGYLDFWFGDVPIVERVAKFAALGIRRMDVWLWRERPMAEIYSECQRHGCIINSTFDPVLGNLVDREDHARCFSAWDESLAMAQRYAIPHLFVFSNQVDLRPNGGEWIAPLTRDYSPGEMYANLLDGLGHILEMAEKTNVTLWFEALNTFHIHGGVFVHTHDQAAAIVRRLNHPKLRLAFDCYHQQRTAGNLLYGLEAYRGLYPTVHIGDVPTRQEPGTGEINYANVARKLHELKFDGLIGMEFTPSGSEADAFRQVQEIFLGDHAHVA
jgi:hydroxypyruvate isomerase